MEITHFFAGGVYAKQTAFRAGERACKHTHDFDHLSVLVSGVVRLRKNKESQRLTGPAMVTVTAGDVHEVEAITDAVWLCIHATDCTDADHIDNVLTRKE